MVSVRIKNGDETKIIKDIDAETLDIAEKIALANNPGWIVTYSWEQRD